MRLLLAVSLALALAAVPIERASACSCAMMEPADAAAIADAVFAGTVVNTQPVGAEMGPLKAVAATTGIPAPMGGIVYTFAVDGVVKGVVGPQAEVLAGGDGAMCGTSFGIDERWLVFATWDGAMLSSGLCSGNLPLEAGAEAPLPLTAPDGDVTSTGPAVSVPVEILGILGVVGAVAAVSWLAFRREPNAPPG